MTRLICALAVGTLLAWGGEAADSLDIYFIDVEGGQATLIVTPAGQSLLVDGGWAGDDNRDPNRILAAARDAGVAQIDYLVVTHFHGDHIGAIPELARLLPIRTFIDYGRPVENGLSVVVPFTAYAVARGTGKHLQPKPGDRLPLEGIEVTVLTANGAALSAPVAGAGQANPACGSQETRRDDRTENHRSLGIRVTFGAFTFIDLGDLSWNPQMRLVCPNNLIGTADVFLVPHHSNSDAAVPALLSAVDSRVLISNNGATKGGAPGAFDVLRRVPHAPDVWQLHRSAPAGGRNVADERIANVDNGDTAFWIKVRAMSDGGFTVTNARNGFSKTY